jgi:hypothetical protein
MPRYVLLYHACPPNYERTSHWDFMLEEGDVLRTWALCQLPRDWHSAHARTRALHRDCPQQSSTNEVEAQQLGDHRLAYLELEGPLSGNCGEVSRVAAGNYVRPQIATDSWVVELAHDLAGTATLKRVTTQGAWKLEFTPAI